MQIYFQLFSTLHTPAFAGVPGAADRGEETGEDEVIVGGDHGLAGDRAQVVGLRHLRHVLRLQTREQAEGLGEAREAVLRVVVFEQRSPVMEYEDGRNCHDPELCVEGVINATVHSVQPRNDNSQTIFDPC